MDFIANFPLFCIVLCLFSGVLCSVLKSKPARAVTYTLVSLVLVMSVSVLCYTVSINGSFTYLMGHFPAPWGNEIRAGILEGIMATFFSLILLLILVSGKVTLVKDIQDSKLNLYYSLVNLLLSSLLALVYTNDLFTGYVFIEINTIAVCGLVMIKNNGKAIFATVKYMIMSLIGSGLFLLALALLYDVTGHLLMCNIRGSVEALSRTGKYNEPLTVIIGLMSVGLAIKSALYPFHSWLPDAHSSGTATSSAILSSLVPKAYIFLLIKIFIRVIGWETILAHHINDIFYIFGAVAIVMGSVHAIIEKDFKRMVAYSSVAQFGYIYMGLGLGTEFGLVSAIYHIFMHGATKSLLFISLAGLSDVSGHSVMPSELKGAGYRNRIAGVAFTVGALTIIGLPLFPGFVSKINFSTAAVSVGTAKMITTLVVLAISTILNAVYFFRAIICIYTPLDEEIDVRKLAIRQKPYYTVAMIAFIATEVFIGTFSDVIKDGVLSGLRMFK